MDYCMRIVFACFRRSFGHKINDKVRERRRTYGRGLTGCADCTFPIPDMHVPAAAGGVDKGPGNILRLLVFTEAKRSETLVPRLLDSAKLNEFPAD